MLAAHLRANQDEARARAVAESFSGIAYEYSSASWALYVAGSRIGAVEDCDAAVALIPTLQQLGTGATLTDHLRSAA